MTEQETKARLLLQALLNNETIQHRKFGEWRPSTLIEFESLARNILIHPEQYRVKPKTITRIFLYRKFLLNLDCKCYEISMWDDNYGMEQSEIEKEPEFIKWLEEPQEIEVEIES